MVSARPGALLGRWCALIAWAFSGIATPAAAQSATATTQVDLLLVLAVDVSGSVNQARFELQRAGYATAFRDPGVVKSIRTGSLKSIAVMMLQWTGPQQQSVVVPWTVIRDERTAEAVSLAIERAPRQMSGGGTSISGAIDFSAKQFALSPWQSVRHVIDVSGDGENNGGRRVGAARDDAIAQGIAINGLPILAVEPFLDDHYRNEVIGGPGAFMIPVQGFEAFADAVRRKLILEISSVPSPVNFAYLATRRPPAR